MNTETQLQQEVTKLQSHKGDPCEFCGIAHDEVPKGSCRGTRDFLLTRIVKQGRLLRSLDAEREFYCLRASRSFEDQKRYLANREEVREARMAVFLAKEEGDAQD